MGIGWARKRLLTHTLTRKLGAHHPNMHPSIPKEWIQPITLVRQTRRLPARFVIPAAPHLHRFSISPENAWCEVRSRSRSGTLLGTLWKTPFIFRTRLTRIEACINTTRQGLLVLSSARLSLYGTREGRWVSPMLVWAW